MSNPVQPFKITRIPSLKTVADFRQHVSALGLELPCEDAIAPGQKVPNGESSMWGDYHLRELALLILREAKGLPYLKFFGACPTAH